MIAHINFLNKKKQLSALTVIFQMNLGQLVPECPHSGFHWS